MELKIVFQIDLYWSISYCFLLNILSYLDSDDAHVIERIIDKNLK
jgi:hypothetical protein